MTANLDLIKAYHCTELHLSPYAEIVPEEKYSDDEFLLPAYKWVEPKIGFYPLFMAVGREKASYITGYPQQFCKVIGSKYDDNEPGKIVKVYRKRGEYPNRVLFVFNLADIPAQRVYSAHEHWVSILNDVAGEREPDKRLTQLAFQPSWNETRWLKRAWREPEDVQIMVPKLDLRRAETVWVRNKAAQIEMQRRGFKNVQVKRLPAPEGW